MGQRSTAIGQRAGGCRGTLLRFALLAVCLFSACKHVPRHVCGSAGAALFRGEVEARDALAQRTIRTLEENPDLRFCTT